MFAEFYACAAMILLDTRDVDGEDFCAIVGEEGGEGTADDFTAVDDCYCAAVETVAVGEDCVVGAEVFEDLDVRQVWDGRILLLLLVGYMEGWLSWFWLRLAIGCYGTSSLSRYVIIPRHLSPHQTLLLH